MLRIWVYRNSIKTHRENDEHEPEDSKARPRKKHPMPKGSWVEPEEGIFQIGDDFYKASGGIFESLKV